MTVAGDASAAQYLTHDGVVAKSIEGFSEREPQLQLVAAIEQSIRTQTTLLAEAGTGTGKTFAYLLPALLSGKKVIIATGTKTLQDQLFEKDLPLLLKAINSPTQSAILKGRANYLCRYRIALNQSDGRFISKESLKDFLYIARVLPQIKTGDIAELQSISEDSPVWPLVTSNADNCLGAECPQYADCFLVKARERALKAEVLVINHHLYFADHRLKEEGFGEILPGAEVIIFDEAHQLPEVASLFFGQRLSTRQVMDLINDIKAESTQQAKDMVELQTQSDELELAMKDLRQALGDALGRMTWAEAFKNLDFVAELDRFRQTLNTLNQSLEQAAKRSKGLNACHQRLVELQALLEVWLNPKDVNQVLWLETFSQTLVLQATPLSIAEKFSSSMQANGANFIFTSATLAVGHSFAHFAALMGIQDYTPLLLESPFDYAQQSLLYMPRCLPAIEEEQYASDLLDEVCPIIKSFQGKTLMLFTSYRMLHRVAQLLNERITMPLLIQGTKAKAKLLDEFRNGRGAVLLATNSFWQGVDIKGQALSCVVIDKLPFDSPQDPILKARFKAIEEQGRSSFNDYLLPRAVIALKQGVGRLIRDEDDKGVVVICDPRLPTRDYGAAFFLSLPRMKITRNQEIVLEFIKSIQSNEVECLES